MNVENSHIQRHLLGVKCPHCSKPLVVGVHQTLPVPMWTLDIDSMKKLKDDVVALAETLVIPDDEMDMLRKRMDNDSEHANLLDPDLLMEIMEALKANYPKKGAVAEPEVTEPTAEVEPTTEVESATDEPTAEAEPVAAEPVAEYEPQNDAAQENQAE